MNIFIVHHRSTHHAKHSGYAKLIDYVDATVIYPSNTFPYRLAKFISTLYSQKKGIFDTSSVLKFWNLYKALSIHRNAHNIVHYLNGERDVRHIGFLKQRFPNTKFVATFHKPPSILEDQISVLKSIEKLDGIIVVGESQLPYFKTALPTKRTSYIPHGVDTNFFTPNSGTQKKGVLFVGVHLRCFETLNKITKSFVEKDNTVHFNVVIKSQYNNKIEPRINTTIIHKVDDDALLQLYQGAELLLLPLKDVTACNSILEGLSVGLPIVTTDLESNKAYLSQSKNRLLENDNLEEIINTIQSIIRDKTLASKMGESSRETAMQFDWAVISKQILQFYKEILDINEA